jgi:hypothetical protein
MERRFKGVVENCCAEGRVMSFGDMLELLKASTGVVAWMALSISIASYFRPNLRQHRNRSRSDKLARLAQDANNLMNRSVSTASQFSEWKIEYGDWLSRTLSFFDRSLSANSLAQLRMLDASQSQFEQAWNETHRGDLQTLEPRYRFVRKLADDFDPDKKP